MERLTWEEKRDAAGEEREGWEGVGEKGDGVGRG